MANEAVILELGGNNGNAIQYTVADGTGIEKGTILKISADPRTAAASASTDVFAGIAAAEKVANDGATKIAVYTQGIFDLTCSTDAVTLGALVSLSGANVIHNAVAADVEGGKVVGKALETGSAGEVIAVAVGYY